MHEREPISMHSTIDHTDEDESKLCEVAKHPFGLFMIYLQAMIGLIIGVGMAYFLLPSVLEDTDSAFAIANIFVGIAIILAILVVVIATIVYRQNRIIVTDRNITQILQYGLFNRKVSQLNLVNVEDVTSIQNGFLATLVGFGDLNIETAGEQVNFHFTLCPRPGYYAKIILNAREKILGQHDGDDTVSPNPANQ